MAAVWNGKLLAGHIGFKQNCVSHSQVRIQTLFLKRFKLHSTDLNPNIEDFNLESQNEYPPYPTNPITVALFHDWIPGCQSKLAQDSGSDLIFGLFAHLSIGCAVADRPLFYSCGKVKIWRSPQLSYNNPMTMSTGHMFQLSIWSSRTLASTLF